MITKLAGQRSRNLWRPSRRPNDSAKGFQPFGAGRPITVGMAKGGCLIKSAMVSQVLRNSLRWLSASLSCSEPVWSGGPNASRRNSKAKALPIFPTRRFTGRLRSTISQRRPITQKGNPRSERHGSRASRLMKDKALSLTTSASSKVNGSRDTV